MVRGYLNLIHDYSQRNMFNLKKLFTVHKLKIIGKDINLR